MDPFLGEIRLFPWGFAPTGWTLCQGQILPIQGNQALYALLGIQYGGNGTTNFALPDLRGRVPVHFGTTYTIGQAAGEATHTLITAEMPNHNHLVTGSTVSPPTETSPTNAYWTTGANSYSSTSNVTMSPAAIAVNGSSVPHNNTQPYLVLNYCIAVTGLFPPRE